MPHNLVLMSYLEVYLVHQLPLVLTRRHLGCLSWPRSHVCNLFRPPGSRLNPFRGTGDHCLHLYLKNVCNPMIRVIIDCKLRAFRVAKQSGIQTTQRLQHILLHNDHLQVTIKTFHHFKH